MAALSLRLKLKTLQEQKSESGCCVTACAIMFSVFTKNVPSVERYFLIYWEEEECVNVVPANSIVKPSPNEAAVGSICQVKVARSVYRGKVAATGKCVFCVCVCVCLHTCA